MTLKKKILIILLSAIILNLTLGALFFYAYFQGFFYYKHEPTGLTFKRLQNMVRIKTALNEYKKLKGKYPTILLELSPFIQNKVFFGDPVTLKYNFRQPANIINKNISKHFAYQYKNVPNNEVLLKEKSKIWRKHKNTKDFIYILFKDGSIKEELLSSNISCTSSQTPKDSE